MKTEAYVDKSLDDFIKANRGMFRRGRGRAPGRGSATGRGGRGGGGGRSPLRGGGRARSRSGSRGRSGSAVRGGGGRAARGRRGRGTTRPQRGTRAASFSRTWRASSARMASRVKGEASASNTPVKRKKVPPGLRQPLITLARQIPILHHLLCPLAQLQVAVKAVRGSKLAGRLGVTPKGVKRVTSLALQKKRKAMQQLTTTGKQLSRADARNQILMRRRGIETEPATTGRGRRGRGRGRGRGGTTALSRGALSARARPARPLSASARTEQKLPLPQGRVRVYHESAAPEGRGRGRRPLNRNSTPAGDPSSLLTVQIKNDLVVRQPPPRTTRRAPQPLDVDEEMAEYTPPPPPPPPPQQRSHSGLDPRIQQEIAAIQARGRQQHHPSGGRISSSLSGFRPTANVSSRTLNDRFTSDRVIYS